MALVGAAILPVMIGCSGPPPPPAVAEQSAGPSAAGDPRFADNGFPWHTEIVSTTFWVGEVFDPSASDGSQELSTYDGRWMESYGGCDGAIVDGICETEERTADNGFFPREMTPLENPFYLDLPFDDINNADAFERRDEVIPWADEPPYADNVGDRNYSYMKNRWVQLVKGDAVCYGQIQDAGPGQYNDAEYVFGTDDARPLNTEFNNAGMDVSPALNGCLGFNDLNGKSDVVDWRFIEESDVPDGPWTEIITRSPVR